MITKPASSFLCQWAAARIKEKMEKLGTFNPLPNSIILAWSKLKALADDKIEVVKMMTSLLDSLENTVGNGENAGYQTRLS